MKFAPKILLTSLLTLFPFPALSADFPWSDSVPPALREEAVLPDRVADEEACNWRPTLTPLAETIVRPCRDAREAVLALASRLPDNTGVRYSIERRKHNMNALEALREKKVSCTGQSVLLVCALRAVDIPARMVGLLTWNHVRGNHSWVEAWFDGEWHMIEYGEKDFNTPWVMENIGMLDPTREEQRIQAISPKGKIPFLPAFAMTQTLLPAVDVSDRYARLAQAYYTRSGRSSAEQGLLVDRETRDREAPRVLIENAAGEIISEAFLPTDQDDVRRFASLRLPREGAYFLRIEGHPARLPLSCTPPPVQILRLK